jgi:hypothetical protein
LIKISTELDPYRFGFERNQHEAGPLELGLIKISTELNINNKAFVIAENISPVRFT